MYTTLTRGDIINGATVLLIKMEVTGNLFENKSWHLIFGDALERTRELGDESIDCIISSPPYYQQRDYEFAGQWGLEETYAEYLEKLWSLMDELWRVLKPEGTCWINLADTYNGNKRGNTDTRKHIHGVINSTINKKTDSTVPYKSLLFIPHRFAIGLTEREPRWIVRNSIQWIKKNAMPEMVKDRFSKKHEYMFFMVKRKKYYFDIQSIKDPLESKFHGLSWEERKRRGELGRQGFGKRAKVFGGSPDGKNPGDVSLFWKEIKEISDIWDIPTKASNSKNYATFNTALVTKPILAGSPEGGVILDPFCGSGTTGVRALELGRRFIGIDGNAEYLREASGKLEIAEEQKKKMTEMKVTA